MSVNRAEAWTDWATSPKEKTALDLAGVMADAIKDALLCGEAVIRVRVQDGKLDVRVQSELHP